MASSSGTPPLSGRLDFTAGGSGTFDRPRYDVRGTISDLFVGDEGDRPGGRRNQHQRRLDDAEARGRLAASCGVGLRPDRADARHGRRAVVQRRRHVARSVRPRVQPAALAVHDRDRQRQHPRGRAAGQHRRAAGGGDGRSARPPAVRLPAAERHAHSHRARSPHCARRRDAARRRGDAARHQRHGRPSRRADRRPRHRRRRPRHPSGVRAEHPQFRARVADSDVRGSDARSGRHRHDERGQRPHPSLRPAARAREHLRSGAVRHPQHSSRRGDRAARRRPGSVRRPDRHRRVSAHTRRRHDDRRRACGCGSPRACGRSSTPT